MLLFFFVLAVLYAQSPSCFLHNPGLNMYKFFMFPWVYSSWKDVPKSTDKSADCFYKNNESTHIYKTRSSPQLQP